MVQSRSGKSLRHSAARRFFHPGRSLYAPTLWKSREPRAMESRRLQNRTARAIHCTKNGR